MQEVCEIWRCKLASANEVYLLLISVQILSFVDRTQTYIGKIISYTNKRRSQGNGFKQRRKYYFFSLITILTFCDLFY